MAVLLAVAPKAAVIGGYRWRDATGNWQYGRIPPPGVDVQTVKVSADRDRRRKENKR